MKLCRDVPDPPTLTEEDLKRVLQEAKEWGEEFRKKTRAIENLTPEDWCTKVK